MRSLFVAFVLAASFLPTSAVRAWSGYQNYVPNGAALFSSIATAQGTGCPMCHRTTSGGDACALGTCPITCTATNRCHNTFGALFMAQSATWTATMAQTDSDGDGWTNGQELGDPFRRWTYGGSNVFGPGYISQPQTASSEPSTSYNVCTANLDDCDSLTTCSDAYTTTGGWTCSACPSGYQGSGHDYTTVGWDGVAPYYDIAVGTGCSDVNECTTLNRCREDDSGGVNTCSNLIGSYDCVCGTGWFESGSGQSRQCLDVDECATFNRCREDDSAGVNTCTDFDGTYDCVCGAGWTESGVGQSRQCLDVDECVSFNRCREDDFAGVNSCADSDGSYDCVCGAGFFESGTGQARQCLDVDECASFNRCREDDFGGVNSCADSDGSYDCVCGAGFFESGTGQSRQCLDVDECATSNPCREDTFPGVNVCTDVDGTFDCTCGAGFTETGTGASRTCSDVDECLANPCGAQGTGCSNSLGSYTCSCNVGYAFDGTTCVVANPCLIPGGPGVGGNDCAANATCSPLGGTSYSCACNAGYQGTGYVATGGCANVNECANAASNNCDAPNATCMDTTGSYVCGCASGYQGDGITTCTDVNECTQPTDPCPGNAICTNLPGSAQCTHCHPDGHVEGVPGNEQCVCNAGYAGDGTTCTDVDECALSPCAADAACQNLPGDYACLTCDVHASVQDVGGVDACVCSAGYTGDGFTCTNVDECAAGTFSCDVNASCADRDGTYDCTCVAGYSGDGQTCTDLDECSLGLAACDPNASCTNGIGSYTCTCTTGWTGDGATCTDDDECANGTDRCDANAVCTNTPGAHTCACPVGYIGDGLVCVDLDDCGTTVCGPGSRCENQPGMPATCVCLPGYTSDGLGGCVSTCGNGLVIVGELCDDGNTADGDGCSSACLIEPGYACYEPGGLASVCAATCGDGFIDPPGESCDDGAANSDTTPGACRENCQLPFCGDGIVDGPAGEACDPGGGGVLPSATCASSPCSIPPDAGLADAGNEPRARGGCVASGRGHGGGASTALLACMLLLRRRVRRHG